jgi:iron complex outermembrane receptor protein
MTYPIITESSGRFDLTYTANFNSTDVTRVPRTAQLAAISSAITLFDRGNRLTFEQGQPETKSAFNATWTLDRFGATLRATRYGSVLSPQNAPTQAAPDFLLTGKTVWDIEARYALNDMLKFAVGADNLFDKYPDPLPPGLNTTGATSFSNLAPFGRSGRFVYGRVTVNF